MPMTESDNSVLVTLFKHNTWANLRLLDYCEKLTPEQLRGTATGTFGDTMNILPHIIGAELSYVERVNGKQPPTPMQEDVFPGFDLMKQLARWSGDEMLALALSARADSLVVEKWPEHKQQGAYPLAGLMVQVINHGADHRSQIATILTQMGLTPPEMDGWVYMEETGEFKLSEYNPEAE